MLKVVHGQKEGQRRPVQFRLVSGSTQETTNRKIPTSFSK
jgi:hypothetical protein